MEENIKIKLNIGDRIYPLTIQRSQEFYFREAAKIIEKTIKNLEENYSVRDKQDLLSMCCIQFAAKNLQNNSKSNDSESEVEKIILKIIDDIDKSILTS
jgi:cell division protein ZapA